MTTTSRVRELFDYDQSTGIFVRRISVARRKKAQAGQILDGTQNNGYMRVMVDGKSILLHRLAFIYMGVELAEQVDHINGVRTDNRWANLRPVSHAENGRNVKKPINNKSGVIGVCWDSITGRWYAQIKHKDKNIFLGRFNSIDEAAKVRKAKEVELGFHKNHGR